MGKKEDVQIVKFGVEIFIFEADLTSHTLRPSDSTPDRKIFMLRLQKDD